MPPLVTTFIEKPYRTETRCCHVPWSVFSVETLEALRAHEAAHDAREQKR
jgi:hypothetical protein